MIKIYPVTHCLLVLCLPPSFDAGVYLADKLVQVLSLTYEVLLEHIVHALTLLGGCHLGAENFLEVG